MRKSIVIAVIFGACAAGWVGCSSSGGDAPKPPRADAPKTTDIGTPNPPFVGEAPKGAMVVEGAEIGRYGGTLVRASAGNPKTFNPIIANESSSTDFLYGPMFSSCGGYHLVRQAEEPGLCEKFERSEDGLTYTFTLREGLRWSDGHPLTTDDVEFAWTIITDPNVANSVKDLFKQGSNPDGTPLFPTFAKVDPRVFRFELARKDVLFHSAVNSVYFVPKHIWEETYTSGNFNNALGLGTPPEKVVVSGPFRLKTFASEERVVLERNPHFWKVDAKGHRLPYLDRVITLIVPDFNAEFLKFTEGETDLHEVRPEQFDALKRREAKADYVVKDLGPAFATYWFMYNLDDGLDTDGKPFVEPMKAKWFNDKRFRKATSHAIDRDGMVRTVLNGRGVPLWTFYSPANKAWAHDGVTKYPYDLEKSRALLRESGFEHRDGKLHDAGGNPVEFSMVTNSENATRVAMLNVIKDDLAKLGITAHIRPVPFNDLVLALRTNRKFDAMLLGWGSGVPPDPAQSRNIMLSSGQSHAWHPSQKTPATEWEARIDALVHETNRHFEHAERKKHHDQLLEILADEQAQITLVTLTDFAAARKNVGNFMPNALSRKCHWNMDFMYLKQPKRRRR